MLVRVLTPSVLPNGKTFKVVLVCCSMTHLHLFLAAFQDLLHLFVLIHWVFPSPPCYFWQLLRMFCTFLSLSPVQLLLRVVRRSCLTLSIVAHIFLAQSNFNECYLPKHWLESMGLLHWKARIKLCMVLLQAIHRNLGKVSLWYVSHYQTYTII